MVCLVVEQFHAASKLQNANDITHTPRVMWALQFGHFEACSLKP